MLTLQEVRSPGVANVGRP